MRRLAAFLLVVAAAGPAAARSRGEVIKSVLPSSVRVSVLAAGKPIRAATGVVLATEQREGTPVSFVVTNAHVVAGPPGKTVAYEILVDERGRTDRHPARLLAVGAVPDQDLAVLAVDGVALPAASLAADGEMELGDDVVAIGAPFGRGLSVSSGIVSQLEWEEGAEGPTRFKTDAPIGYGASGGGIFRVPDGKLLAVVEGYRTAKVSAPADAPDWSFDVPMPGETFAAPVAKLRRFLAKNGLARLVDRAAPAPETPLSRAVSAPPAR